MAEFWGWLVAVFGLLGAALYMGLVIRARRHLTFAQLLIGMGIVCSCAYAGVLWFGQRLGLLVITAEMGRPALALSLLALVLLGGMAYAPRQEQ